MRRASLTWRHMSTPAPGQVRGQCQAVRIQWLLYMGILIVAAVLNSMSQAGNTARKCPCPCPSSCPSTSPAGPACIAAIAVPPRRPANTAEPFRFRQRPSTRPLAGPDTRLAVCAQLSQPWPSTDFAVKTTCSTCNLALCAEPRLPCDVMAHSRNSASARDKMPYPDALPAIHGFDGR